MTTLDALPDPPPIKAMPRRGRLPLSYQQAERLYDEMNGRVGLRLANGDTIPVNLSSGLHVKGPLEVSRVQSALNEVVRRHETLRTRLVLSNGTAMQEVASPREVEVTVTDYRGGGRRIGGAVIEALLRPFDYRQGVLLRGHVVRLADNEHIVLAVLPHLMSDDPSTHVLADEIVHMLDLGSADVPTQVPELAVQYGDFVAWQRSWLRGAARSAIRSYCAAHLAHATAVHLPYDYPGPDMKTCDADVHRFELSPELAAAIRRRSVEASVSTFMVLLSAYNIVLARWSDQDDITILTPFAARSHEELVPLIGLVTNLCPVRTDLSGGPTFDEALKRTRRSVLTTSEFQSVPYTVFEEVVAERGDTLPAPTASINWIVPAGPVEHRHGARSGLTFTRHAVDFAPDIATYQLYRHISLWITASSERRIAAAVVYRTALFERRTIAAFVEDLKAVLQRIVGAPRGRIRARL